MINRTIRTFLVLATLAAIQSAAGAEQESIDQLLHKLPPPEKLVRPRDPILNDPLAKQTIGALNARDLLHALNLSRQLSHRYRENAIAHGLHGWVAFTLRQFGEASSEFRGAVGIDPKYSFGYFGLGLAEASQMHFATALQNFQQLAQLEPKAEIAWIASSGCAERLGRRQQSLEYAKHATAMAPGSAAAWLQLARVENDLGDKAASDRAFARAKELGLPRSTRR